MNDDAGDNSGSAYLFLGALYTQLYCIPGSSAKGCFATLSTFGTASVGESSGFVVTADGVQSGINGLYFYGVNGPQMAPWGNGSSFQCVVPPVIRFPVQTSTGPTENCSGNFSLDLNAAWCPTCPLSVKSPGAGAEIWLQLWYRDPQNTSNQATSFSNAAMIGVCP